MRFLYSLALYLGVPFLLLHLWWRGWRNRAYRKRWAERFGFLPALTEGCVRVWIHAVSVGEVQASLSLVRRLRNEHPFLHVLVTTTTPSGSERARKLLPDDVDHAYVPYDLPGAGRRFLQRAKPSLAVFMETELWPNLFRRCQERGIPVVVANARLSERSAAGYRRVPALTRSMLADVSVVAARSDTDARRFVGLGLPEERVQLTGNLKFDQMLPDELAEQARALRRQWSTRRPVWIAASTHPGEHELVLGAQRAVLERHPKTLLILVPRHSERCTQIDLAVRRADLRTCLLSKPDALSDGTQVLLGDEMGELLRLYAASDVAFVGGSLVPHGGHNLLEPAGLGIPVLTGPHFFNFEEIAQELIAGGAARQVMGAESLAATLVELLLNKDIRSQMGESGRRIVLANRGALGRLMGVIQEYV